MAMACGHPYYYDDINEDYLTNISKAATFLYAVFQLKPDAFNLFNSDLSMDEFVKINRGDTIGFIYAPIITLKSGANPVFSSVMAP